MPVNWSEVESDALRPDGVGIRNVSEWLRHHEDPWKAMERSGKSLPSLKASEMPDRSGRRKGVSKKAVT